MRALSRILLALGLMLGPLLAPGCKSAAEPGTTTTAPNKPARKPGMPKPYRLPATPEFAAYVANPAAAIVASRAYAPGAFPNARTLLQTAISATPTGLDGQLVAAVDLYKPWAAAEVEGQQILWLPITDTKRGVVAGLFAPKPPEGKFGAVNLQRTGVGPKLAWLDTDTGYIALADDLRGIATARTLPNVLGRDGLNVRASAQQAQRFTGQAPFSRLEARGAGPHEFKLVLYDANTSQLPELAEFSEGALTGMLQSKQIAAGASSKYKNYASWVKSVLSNAKRQVDRQNFFVRGNLEALRGRLGAMLRSWDGRVMAGVANGHVLLGFGSSKPANMRTATHRLIEGVRDNVEMLRMFTSGVPKILFNKKKMTVQGQTLANVAIKGARKVVPSQYASLIDDRGDLRISMVFPERAGGAMVVIGPSAHLILKKWLEETNKATSGTKSQGDLAAATFAVSPSKVAGVGSADLGAVIRNMLKLKADRKPTLAVVRRDGARYEIDVRGPKIAARPGTTRASGGARSRGARAAGPSRAAPSGTGRRAKPSGGAKSTGRSKPR